MLLHLLSIAYPAAIVLTFRRASCLYRELKLNAKSINVKMDHIGPFTPVCALSIPDSLMLHCGWVLFVMAVISSVILSVRLALQRPALPQNLHSSHLQRSEYNCRLFNRTKPSYSQLPLAMMKQIQYKPVHLHTYYIFLVLAVYSTILVWRTENWSSR